MFQGIEKESVEGLVSRLQKLTMEDVEQAYRQRKKECVVQTGELENGQSIQLLEKDGVVWQMNSAGNPDEAATLWALQYAETETNQQTVFLVYGLGDGKAVRALYQLKPMCRIVVYEPCQELFWEAIGREEVAEVLNTEQICVLVKGICEEYYFHALQQWLNYSNYQLVVHGVLPNYDRIFKDEYRAFLETYVNVVELITYTRNTELERGLEIARNFYALTKDIIEQYSVTQLEGIVNKKGLEDIPAILVAAGPSLDKNIKELKNAEGRAFLLVVDTALNTVLENGIRPDMTISVDSRKPMTLFKHKDAGNIPIELSPHSNRKVAEGNTARHFYEIDKESYLNRIFWKVTGKKGEQLPTGGSVANNALSLLMKMGFQTIILVGQDLAYPGGKGHTAAAYNSEKDCVKPDEKEYIEVEDIYGNKVLTEANMNIYRKWIENNIAAYHEIRVIDATEGGAKIAGTEILTLKESIAQTCQKTFDRSDVLELPNAFFTKEEQQKLKEKIRKIPDELALLENKISEGKKLYKKLSDWKSQGKKVQIKKILTKIAILNAEIEELDSYILIRPYMIEQDYEVSGEIYQYGEGDSLEQQIKDIVQYGVKLLNGYEEGIKGFREDMHLLTEQFEG